MYANGNARHGSIVQRSASMERLVVVRVVLIGMVVMIIMVVLSSFTQTSR